MTKFGGLLKSTSALAVVAAAGLFMGGMTPSKAADLGGDCCADLEERVAELEATTVRKGNRVMSVTLTGRVDEALLFFDEGTGGDQDVYVVDRGSRFRIEGAGNVRPGLKLGYRIELNTRPNAASKIGPKDETDPNGDNGDNNVFGTGDVYWYADHESLGRLTVGNASGSMDNVGNVNLPGSIFDGAGSYASGIGISGKFNTVGGMYGSVVRWDTPTFGNALGFSASWGQDDVWSVAAVYGQEFNGLRIAASTVLLYSTFLLMDNLPLQCLID